MAFNVFSELYYPSILAVFIAFATFRFVYFGATIFGGLGRLVAIQHCRDGSSESMEKGLQTENARRKAVNQADKIIWIEEVPTISLKGKIDKAVDLRIEEAYICSGWVPKRLEEKTTVKADAAEALATLKKQSETEMAAVIHVYQIEISNSTTSQSQILSKAVNFVETFDGKGNRVAVYATHSLNSSDQTFSELLECNLQDTSNHTQFTTSPREIRLGQGTRTFWDKVLKFTDKELANMVREVYDLVKYEDVFFAGKSMTSLQLRFWIQTP
ncbi:MAG: hypothetical protein Q9199_003601 [Rusavskia elegans]